MKIVIHTIALSAFFLWNICNGHIQRQIILNRNILLRSPSHQVPHYYSNLKLPVWPVLGGVMIQLADLLGAKGLSEKLWSTVGGRVVPITLSNADVSPFLLLGKQS